MEKFPLRAALIISGICLLTIIARIIWPSLAIDDKTLYFLALGIIPWLTLFFKKIKFGDVEVEGLGKQGTTKAKPPIDKHSNTEKLTLNEKQDLSNDAKKVLATLWRYQKLYFSNEPEKRWTFLINPNSEAYTEYLYGMVELMKLGYITINKSNNQIKLTNEGLNYASTNQTIQNYPEYFHF